MMRLINLKSIFSLVAFAFLSMVATAQFDDLYYDPTEDDGSIFDADNTEYEDSYVYNDVDDYDSDYESDYDYDSDYYDDYSYTRRINRFRRNACVSNYYSSIYYDDPFFNPGFQMGNNIFITVGNGWGFNNRWSRWNRWNRWNSWNSWNRWDSWNNPYCGPNAGFGISGYYAGFNGINNYYGNNYFGNSFYNNVNVSTNPNGTHYGSRRNGSLGTSTNGRNIKTPRLTSPTRDPESGAVSSSTYSEGSRTNGVRKRVGDGEAVTRNNAAESTKTTTRRRSNGDTIYSGRKRSARSSDRINSSNRRSSGQNINRRNSSSNRSNMGNSSRRSSRSSGVSSRRSNTPSARSSSRGSSSRSSSSRSSSSRSKKRGGK